MKQNTSDNIGILEITGELDESFDFDEFCKYMEKIGAKRID